MGSAFKAARGEPSLSFKSSGVEYTLTEPWTDELLLEILDGNLIKPLRKLMGSSQWNRWKVKNHKRADLDTLLKDSFSTLGVDGQTLYDLLAVLTNDKWCRAFEYDLLQAGYDLNCDLRTLCILYEGNTSGRLNDVIVNNKPGDWKLSDYMLADVIDLLNYNLMMTHVVAQVGGLKSKIKAPKPIYKRPNEVEVEKKTFTSPLALKGLLEAGRKGKNGNRSRQAEADSPGEG